MLKANSVYPILLTVLDEFFLTDDNSDYPMAFPSEWHFTGSIDRTAFEASFLEALERHPLLYAVVKPVKRGKLCWTRPRDLPPPKIDWAVEGTPIECPPDSEINPKNGAGMRVWVRQGTEKSYILFQFHHAATDGTGAHRFIGDLFALYGQRTGTGDKLPTSPMTDPRSVRNRSRKLSQGFDEGNIWSIAKATIRQAWEMFGRRLSLLTTVSSRGKKNGHVSSATFPGFATYSFNKWQHKELREAAKRYGVTLNDLLMGELFRTMVEWNKRTGQPSKRLYSIMMPSDLREKEDHAMAAANMTSYTFIRRSPKAMQDTKAFMSGIWQETSQIKRERRAMQWIDSLITLSFAKGAVQLLLKINRCNATAVLSHVGDPSRRFTTTFPRKKGQLIVGNLLVEAAHGVSPIRRHTRAAFTVNTLHRELNLAVRTDPRYFTPEESRQLLDLYGESLSRHLDTPENVAEEAETATIESESKLARTAS